MINNTLPLSVRDLLTDTKTALDSLAISLDFVAHGVREYHPGAYWLIISLSDQCCDLVERLNKFIADDKPGLSEITFAVSTEEAALIDQYAEKWDITRDEAATRLAKEGLQSLDHRLKNPLVSILPLNCPNGAAETVGNIADQLMLLADLFGNDDDRYIVLNTNASYRAMYLQLSSMALLLEAVGQALTVETTKASP